MEMSRAYEKRNSRGGGQHAVLMTKNKNLSGTIRLQCSSSEAIKSPSGINQHNHKAPLPIGQLQGVKVILVIRYLRLTHPITDGFSFQER